MRKTIFLILGLILITALASAVCNSCREEITAQSLTYVTPHAISAWQDVNTGTQMAFTVTGEGRQLLLINTATNLTDSPTLMTIERGVGQASPLGNYTLNLSTNETYIIGPLSTGRYEQNDGRIYVDFDMDLDKLMLVNLP